MHLYPSLNPVSTFLPLILSIEQSNFKTLEAEIKIMHLLHKYIVKNNIKNYRDEQHF